MKSRDATASFCSSGIQYAAEFEECSVSACKIYSHARKPFQDGRLSEDGDSGNEISSEMKWVGEKTRAAKEKKKESPERSIP